jgi:hypothetical protein
MSDRAVGEPGRFYAKVGGSGVEMELTQIPGWAVGGIGLMMGAGFGYFLKCLGDLVKKPGNVILSGRSDQQRLTSRRLQPWLA